MRTAFFNILGTTTSVLSVTIQDGISSEPFLEFEFPDDFEYEKGADGLLIRCNTNDTEVHAKMSLMRSSKENDKLSLARTADLKVGGGAGVGTFLHKDNNGTTLIASPRCWIHKLPNFTVARKTGVVVWDLVMQIQPGSVLLGGHSVE
jgi:hypothetical protein